MRKANNQTMKKTLAIGLGIMGGVLAIGAVAGITLGLNAHFRDLVQNKVQNVFDEDAMDLSKTKIESSLDLTKAEKADQGVQADAATKGKWLLQFDIKDLPSEVNEATVKLQSNIIRGDTKKAYFLAQVGDEQVAQYEGITHEVDDGFALEHDLLKKSGSETYVVRTYWIAHPSVYVDTKITFSYEAEEVSSAAASNAAIQTGLTAQYAI